MSGALRKRLYLGLAVLFGAAVFSATASALPGDPTIDPLSPADGATATGGSAGIEVTFTCPVYRSIDLGTGFAVFGGVKDHGVQFATGPELGTDGRLRQDLVVGRQGPPSTPNTLPSGQCAAALTGAPSSTPGTYYWQVWRLCGGCATGYEVGPTRRFVVTSPAALRLTAAKRAYAGYGFPTTIAATGVPTGTTIQVQRRAGNGWTAAASTSVVAEQASAFVVLPRGVQRIRAVVTLGTETISSPEQSVTVLKPSVWTTTPAAAGRYRGSSTGTESIRFLVAGNGREIRNFSGFVSMTCPGITPGQFTIQIGTALIRRARIAPDGSFVAVASPATNTAIELRGRLVGRRVQKAVVSLSVGTCTGQQSFRARRIGR